MDSVESTTESNTEAAQVDSNTETTNTETAPVDITTESSTEAFTVDSTTDPANTDTT